MMHTTLMLTAALLLGSPLAAFQPPAAAPAQPAVTIPDTAGGQALTGFVASFNAGGDKRRAWLTDQTTMEKDQVEGILKQDAEIVAEHGSVTVVRIPSASAASITAVLRHATSGAHGHLTLDIEQAAPHKVSNMQLRAATPEEIKGK